MIDALIWNLNMVRLWCFTWKDEKTIVYKLNGKTKILHFRNKDSWRRYWRKLAKTEKM